MPHSLQTSYTSLKIHGGERVGAWEREAEREEREGRKERVGERERDRMGEW